ncbi:phosphomethylpyrimidine kinase [Gaiella occulta]|uniref:Phosphomethylpyrimidine kinase n=1 Tax=Gaiella occulta TaxID=1002870 RepID=A0A7M2YTX9_9ACTN|nr:bifunctional hydroxymethylpyrimidine kinase/phosphomethylpyrimidine kinase [Gaiella occulta]RDI73601.1 phosphomethylpyrimidine kinase [Gaiella occulta]
MVRLLSVAGSDSGGGAGIQADLKVFAALGVHGMTALTALTAQHTQGVEAVHEVPPWFVRAQIRAVVGDIGVDAVKVGMLAAAGIVEVVADELAELDRPVVIDPVMVATSGARLLAEDAVDALRERLLPLATLATPNLAEARVLAGDLSLDAEAAAAAVHSLGPGSVVVTGGDEDGVDWFHDASGLRPIEGPLHASGATHGSGCAHSAALAVYLAQGYAPFDAAVAARALAARAVACGLEDLGGGPGPVNVGAAVVAR